MRSLKEKLRATLVFVGIALLSSCDKNDLEVIQTSESKDVTMHVQRSVALRSSGNDVVSVGPTSGKWYRRVEKYIYVTFVNVGDGPITLYISTVFADGMDSNQINLQPGQEYRVSEYDVSGHFEALYKTEPGYYSQMTISWTLK